MEEHSAFTKRHIEEVTTAKQTLLEEMNLPPAVIAYIRANKVMLWSLFFAIIALICGYRYYNYYTLKVKNNGAQALSLALEQQDEAGRKAALQQVAAKYGSSGAGDWSKIHQARDLAENGNYDQALTLFNEVFVDYDQRDAGYPLLVNGIGQLHEAKGDNEQALSWYEKLRAAPGFQAYGYIASGRVYEKMANNAKAREMYENANTDSSLQADLKNWLETKIATL